MLYWTVTLKATECCGPALVSATITLIAYDPGGVPGFFILPLPPPPHPCNANQPAARISNKHVARKREPHRLVLAGEMASPTSPANARLPAGIHGTPAGWSPSRSSMATAAVVEIVSLPVIGELPVDASVVGENVQVASLGNPVQERLNEFLNSRQFR